LLERPLGATFVSSRTAELATRARQLACAEVAGRVSQDEARERYQQIAVEVDDEQARVGRPPAQRLRTPTKLRLHVGVSAGVQVLTGLTTTTWRTGNHLYFGGGISGDIGVRAGAHRIAAYTAYRYSPVHRGPAPVPVQGVSGSYDNSLSMVALGFAYRYGFAERTARRASPYVGLAVGVGGWFSCLGYDTCVDLGAELMAEGGVSFVLRRRMLLDLGGTFTAHAVGTSTLWLLAPELRVGIRY
jgi:hypothetical protein